jgi:hypothetical protein
MIWKTGVIRRYLFKLPPSDDTIAQKRGILFLAPDGGSWAGDGMRVYFVKQIVRAKRTPRLHDRPSGDTNVPPDNQIQP